MNRTFLCNRFFYVLLLFILQLGNTVQSLHLCSTVDPEKLPLVEWAGGRATLDALLIVMQILLRAMLCKVVGAISNCCCCPLWVMLLVDMDEWEIPLGSWKWCRWPPLAVSEAKKLDLKLSYIFREARSFERFMEEKGRKKERKNAKKTKYFFSMMSSLNSL